MVAVMTEEDAFHAMIDAAPEDNAPRLVFADWLEERGDERAEGYRALGRLWLYPCRDGADSCWWISDVSGMNPTHNYLPDDWYVAVSGGPWNQQIAWRWPRDGGDNRKIHDAAALAFLRLPAKRRRELLTLRPAAG